jgi:hypothetical protein
MKRLNTIKTFEFDSAHYRIDDGHGDQVELSVDYKHNQFRVAGTAPANPAFRQEIAELATDLLGRKHGKNFASKFTG